MSIEIELVALARLKPNADNAKEHTPEQIEQLRASIRRFGFRDPIGVDADDNIIEGHGRYQAALAEGMEEVPVIRLAHLSGRERDAYAIAHNQTQLRSGFDLDKLKEELTRLDVQDGDFMSLGFNDDDIHFLGVNAPPPAPQPDTTSGSGYQPTEGQGWGDLIQPVIKTTIRFSDEQKYLHFMQLMEALGSRYPDERRLSQRLLQYARDNAAG